MTPAYLTGTNDDLFWNACLLLQSFREQQPEARLWVCDFGLTDAGLALKDAPQRYTYSTVGLYRHALFDGLPAGNPQGLKAPLAPLLRAAMDNGRVTAELWRGPWTDVGTPERLAQLNEA